MHMFFELLWIHRQFLLFKLYPAWLCPEHEVFLP